MEFGQIPKSWNVTTIDECTEIVTDYVANGSFASLKENVNYLDADGFAWLVRLRDYHNGFGNDRVWIDEHAYHFLAKSKLFGGEVIVSNVGQPGVVFRAPSRDKFPMSLGPNSIMMRFCESDAFYFYWLKSPFGQYMMDGIIGGSAQQKFNKTSFKKIECPRPPIQEQEAIAEVLSSLDDKIDLLKRQNKTLEGMAEALFRQWFIEEAQDDWEEISIYDTCSVTYGFPFKSKQFNDDQVGTPILRIRDLKNGICGVSSLEACEDKYIIDKGDLVAGMDGEFRLYQWSGSRCHLNQRVCKFTPNQSFGSFFCYFSIGKALQYFERVKVGTTVIHLGKGDIDSIAFKVPSRFRVEEFNRQTRPYWNRINCNNELIGNLSAQRDTLLPKLMSGEVRVQMD